MRRTSLSVFALTLAGCGGAEGTTDLPYQDGGREDGTSDGGFGGFDGGVDEAATDGGAENCAPGARRACYPGDSSQLGKGSCMAGEQTCVGAREFGTWGDCVDAVLPTAEICNGKDDDCDGEVDEGCECPEGEVRACGPAAVGICKPGSQTCIAGAWGACVGEVKPAVGGELCGNKLDDDCDGEVDEGCACDVVLKLAIVTTGLDGDHFQRVHRVPGPVGQKGARGRVRG